MIAYKVEKQMSRLEFINLLKRSGLAERRPADPERLGKMLIHANLVITARINGELIGIARSLSDFTFCTYLSDLAVDIKFQRQGIGKELTRLTKEYAPEATLILLAAPAAMEYYPKIGMERCDRCFILK